MRVDRPAQEPAYKIDLTWPRIMDIARNLQIENLDMQNSNSQWRCELSGRLMCYPITIDGHQYDLLEFMYQLTCGESASLRSFTSFDQIIYDQVLADDITNRVRAPERVQVLRFGGNVPPPTAPIALLQQAPTRPALINAANNSILSQL